MIDSAAKTAASLVEESRGVSFFTPASNVSMGSCIPITPVEATNMLSVGIPNASPAALAVFSQ